MSGALLQKHTSAQLQRDHLLKSIRAWRENEDEQEELHSPREIETGDGKGGVLDTRAFRAALQQKADRIAKIHGEALKLSSAQSSEHQRMTQELTQEIERLRASLEAERLRAEQAEKDVAQVHVPPLLLQGALHRSCW